MRIYAMLLRVFLITFSWFNHKSFAIRGYLERGGGLMSPKLEVFDFPGMGLGFRAVELIRPSETLFVVPHSLCFVSQIAGSNQEAETDVALQLALARKLGKDSDHTPFIDTLPVSSEHIPALFGPEKLSALEGTAAAEDAVAMCNEWLETIKKLRNLPSSENSDDLAWVIANEISDKEWLWARASVQCRAFEFAVKPEDTESSRAPSKHRRKANANKNIQPMRRLVALIPPVSMANHNDKVFCSVKRGNGVVAPEDCFVIQSPRQISYYPGQQVCISYGELTFQQKFLSFGWVDVEAVTNEAPALMPAPSVLSGKNTQQSAITAVSVAGRMIELKTPLPPSKETNMVLQDRIITAVIKATYGDGDTDPLRSRAETGVLLQEALLSRKSMLCDRAIEGESLWPNLDVVRHVELQAVEALLTQLEPLLKAGAELGGISIDSLSS
jgi:hypothetical protein